MKKILLTILAVFPILSYANEIIPNEFNSKYSNLNGIGINSIDIVDVKDIDLSDGEDHVCKCINSIDEEFYVHIKKDLNLNIYRIKTKCDFLSNIFDNCHTILDEMRFQAGWNWYNSQMQEIDGYAEDPIETESSYSFMYVNNSFGDNSVKTSFESLFVFSKWVK